VLVSALGAFAIRIITVHAGPFNYGLYVSALIFVTTAMLLTDLGISAITGREIAKHPDAAADILGHNMGLRLVLSLALIPVLIGLSLLIYGSAEPDRLWAIALLSLAIPFDALRSISLGYFVSSIRNYYGSAVTLLQLILYVAGVVVALATRNGIVGCAGSYLVSTATTGAIAFFVARREVSFRPLFNVGRWRKILGQSMSLGVIQVVNMFYVKADTLLLSKMASPRAVGYYGVAYSFTTFFVAIPTLLMTSLLPLIARGTPSELSSIVRRSAQMMATVGVLVATGTAIFASPAIRLLSDQRYLAAATPLRILAVACVLIFLNAVLGYAAVARDQHHRIVYVSVAGLVLNVATNVIAIPRYGINGAATATLLSEVVTLAGVRYFFRRDVDVPVSLTSSLTRPVGAGLTVVAMTHFVLVRSWSPPIASLAWVPVVAVMYFGLLALVGGLPEDVSLIKDRLISHRSLGRNQ
jgi:O-antigen/teichoic acid export membrane protein